MSALLEHSGIFPRFESEFRAAESLIEIVVVRHEHGDIHVLIVLLQILGLPNDLLVVLVNKTLLEIDDHEGFVLGLCIH